MARTGNIDANLENRIACLAQSLPAHLELTKRILEVDGGRIFGVDLIACAVLNRSRFLIEGFIKMIETKNMLCAGGLLRLQVDSLMRFNACWLVNEPHSLLGPLLRGERLSAFKSKNGKKLTDAYLKEELSKAYPWVPSVYDATSGFIHLSKVHMFSIVEGVDDAANTMSLGNREVGEEELKEAVEAFIEATRCVFHLVASWAATKDAAGLKQSSP